jgi:hypothetical protein
MKHPEHLNPRFVHYEGCDSGMTIEGFPNLPVGDGLIPLAQPRVLTEKLHFREDAPNDAKSSLGIVGCDIPVNLFEASHRLESPPYFRHDSIAFTQVQASGEPLDGPSEALKDAIYTVDASTRVWKDGRLGTWTTSPSARSCR